jgi:transcriptional regulator with XRE-family HTH domain
MITELGKFLRKARIDIGVSLRDMARDIEISPAFLSSIETGKKNIKEPVILALAEYLKMDSKKTESFGLIAMRSNKEVLMSLEDKSKEEVDTFTLLARRIGDLNIESLEGIRKIINENQAMN